jgi:nucleotide-binding universal stress UspA family protein
MLDCFLVVLEDNADALIPYAVSVAKTLKAHVTAITPRPENDASLDTFAQAAGAAGVSADIVAPDAEEHPPRDGLPRFARAFDFAMVQQREPGRAPTRDDLTAALLADSGRPVWVVPAIQRKPAEFKHVLVAWDGGAAPAEAFSEAKRVFERAGRVDIVTVANATTNPLVFQGGERLAARLKRAGVAGEFRRLPSDEDPANALLSYAADVGADLLVCGGYSHSPLRESLFGGATRTLLTSMTLPTFFAR